MSLRCAIYARYSTDRQNPLSISDQVHKCREFSVRENWTILEQHIYSDEAQTGTLRNRAGFRRMMTAASQKPRPFDAILVEDTSRFSRRNDLLDICDRLSFHGVKVCFVSQGIRSSDEKFRFLLAARGLVDMVFVEDTSRRVRRGMQGLARRGFHTGGRCFGYRKQLVEDPAQFDEYGRPRVVGVRLALDPVEAETIRRIFRLYADGYSMKRIARLLNADGIVSPRPQTGRVSRSWCHSSVRKILTNDRYRGLIVWGQSKKVKSPDTDKRVKRPQVRAEWVMLEAPEQRIVSDELWEQVERRREHVKVIYANTGRRAGLLRGQAATSVYLFSGLLKCGLCGANLQIVSGPAKSRPSPSYGCPLSFDRGVCRNGLRIPKDVLEEKLLEKIQGEILQREAIDYTLDRFKRELLAAIEGMGSEMDQLQERERTLRKEIGNLTLAIEQSAYQSPAVMARIAEKERELEGIVAKLLDSEPDSVRSRVKNLRQFVLSRLADVRGMLGGDARSAKAEIANHVRAIRLYPEGSTYRIEGDWSLLGLGEMGYAGGRS